MSEGSRVIASKSCDSVKGAFPRVASRGTPGVRNCTRGGNIVSFFDENDFSSYNLCLRMPGGRILDKLSQVQLFLVKVFNTIFITTILLTL